LVLLGREASLLGRIFAERQEAPKHVAEFGHGRDDGRHDARAAHRDRLRR
jgi:hypothetical protein